MCAFVFLYFAFWTGSFPAFFPCRKQVLQSRFWGCKGNIRQSCILADVFWMAGLLNEILKALTAREWSSGSPCQAGECFVGYSWEANTNRLDLLSLV